MSINRKLAIHIFIKGRVQGVSFCYFTLKQAQNLNTEGWVRNNPKGNVEAFAQGDKTNLELFIDILQQGPPFSQVDDVRLNWKHADKDYTDFTIA